MPIGRSDTLIGNVYTAHRRLYPLAKQIFRPVRQIPATRIHILCNDIAPPDGLGLNLFPVTRLSMEDFWVKLDIGSIVR